MEILDRKTLLILVFGLVVIGALVLMFSSAIGSRLVWLIIYSILCMLFGLIFYIFTGGNDASVTVDFKNVAIRLGGGAAIGIGVVLLLNWFVVKPPFDERVLAYQLDKKYYNELSSITGKSMNILEITRAKRADFLLVEFLNSEDGWIEVSVPNIEEAKYKQVLVSLHHDNKIEYKEIQNEK